MLRHCPGLVLPTAFCFASNFNGGSPSKRHLDLCQLLIHPMSQLTNNTASHFHFTATIGTSAVAYEAYRRLISGVDCATYCPCRSFAFDQNCNPTECACYSSIATARTDGLTRCLLGVQGSWKVCGKLLFRHITVGKNLR